MLFVCHPKFCISIVFSFSWGHFNSQEKLQTMLMPNVGVTNKEHYGMLWQFWSGQYLISIVVPRVTRLNSQLARGSGDENGKYRVICVRNCAKDPTKTCDARRAKLLFCTLKITVYFFFYKSRLRAARHPFLSTEGSHLHKEKK